MHDKVKIDTGIEKLLVRPTLLVENQPRTRLSTRQQNPHEQYSILNPHHQISSTNSDTNSSASRPRHLQCSAMTSQDVSGKPRLQMDVSVCGCVSLGIRQKVSCETSSQGRWQSISMAEWVHQVAQRQSAPRDRPADTELLRQ